MTPFGRTPNTISMDSPDVLECSRTPPLPECDLSLSAAAAPELLGAGHQTLAVGGGRLVNLDVGEHHDCQGPVEAHRAREHQVADVLSEGALPGRSGAWR